MQEAWGRRTGTPAGAPRAAFVLAIVAVLAAGLHPTGPLAARGDDAAPGAWRAVEDMAHRRAGHTATVLDGPACRAVGTPAPAYCGKVLVVGTTAEPLSGSGVAELYDPATGTWSPAPPLNRERSGHAATLLDGPACGTVEPPPWCGWVLVSGGDGVGTAELFDPAAAGGQGAWRPAGSLLGPRSDHTATLLADGRVLVAGGQRRPLDVAETAELYDPAAGPLGAWRRTGDLGKGRFFHTATLLGGPRCRIAGEVPRWCGTVLVAGGRRGSDGRSRSSAELFDPKATSVVDGAQVEGGWRPTGALVSAQARHTATLLADGEVLVAGGGDVTAGARDSAELYDPAGVAMVDGVEVEGAWRLTAQLAESRTGHTATLLGGAACATDAPPAWCGRVLVAGGRTAANVPLRSAELYDPEGGSWSPTGSMIEARADHAAALLSSGEVLVGGSLPVGEDTLATAEVFDPGAVVPPPSVLGVCVPDVLAGPCVSPAAGPTGGGTAVEISGVGLDGVTSVRFGGSPAFGFEPVSSTLVRAVSPPTTVAGTVAVTVTTAAGTSAATSHARFTYEGSGPGTGPPQVAGLDPPSGPAGRGTEVSVRGSGFFPAVDAVHFGDVAATGIRVVSDSEVRATAPALAKGSVAVTVTVPGRGTSAAGSAPAFTYEGGTWAHTGPLGTARYLHSAALLDGPECRTGPPPEHCGKVLLAGGTADFADGAAFMSAELYDPSAGSGTFTATSPMVAAVPGRMDFTATVLEGDACERAEPSTCGWVLAVGGRPSNTLSPPLATAELYDPASGTWRATASLAEGRFSHTATLLRDGRVLVVGGTTSETDNRPPLASVEIYDPATGTWATAPPLDSCASDSTSCRARASHSASLLPDGRVLVAGGHLQVPTPDGVRLEPLASAQVYDPSAGPSRAWRATADLASARFSHTVTVLEGERCGARCGQVLAIGGIQSTDEGTDGVPRPLFVRAAELFDPRGDGGRGSWTPAAVPNVARGGHTATVLGDGTVLAAGADATFPAAAGTPTASSEVFDPGTGTWWLTGSMAEARGIHTATRLDGPACRVAPPAAWCGSVLVAGGGGPGVGAGGLAPPPIGSAERYTASAEVVGVVPGAGPSAGGTEVEIAGANFTGAVHVSFGGVAAPGVTVVSPTLLRAVSPRHVRGPVQVEVAGAGGSSATTPPSPRHRFTFAVSGPPAAIGDLAARAVTDDEVELTFSAPPSDGDLPPPATAYVVKQSDEPVTDDATFEAASTLCDPCTEVLSPGAVGDGLSLTVAGLGPGATYHFSVRAVNEAGMVGPLSNPAVVSLGARTGSAPAVVTPPACPPVAAVLPGQVVYPAGYSIVGLPEGSVVPAQSPLYGWLDQGAGGSYSSHDTVGPVAGGRGYYAWFACPAVVTAAPGRPTTSLALRAFRASLVGNPSGTAPATVTGHDYAARWDPTIGGGAGGYRLSGYREPQTLAVGEGVWVFSYRDTTVRITASR